MTTAILQYASTRSFSVFRTLATPLLLSLSVGFGASAQGLAQDCADIKAANPAATDGTYVIAPGGNPFFVHCHDMAGTPREYLTLTPLALAALLLGIFPQSLLNWINPYALQFVHDIVETGKMILTNR